MRRDCSALLIGYRSRLLRSDFVVELEVVLNSVVFER